MKVGIVGGTFNPIHLGHLMLGEYAHEECGLDEVWFMPNGNPPHKTVNRSEISTEKRIEMTKLAIEDTAYFRFQPYEINRTAISYSYQTMEEFSRIYPDIVFYFIIGSDSLFALETWRCPDKLLRTCSILVACRENIDIRKVKEHITYLNTKYHCDILLLQMPLLEISSSDIRKRVEKHQSVKYILPDCIAHYIEENKLYEGSKNGIS